MQRCLCHKLIRVQPGLKNAVTLFHAPSNPGSTRILTLLKQAQAQSKASATQDQASSHATQDKLQQAEFDLDVVEDPPTPGQMVAILEFMGGPRASPIGKIVVDARNEFDAIRKLEASRDVVKRPLVRPAACRAVCDC